eukprot:scaffold52903_cov61-Phaeocystis_antarctica.AAC.4
MVPAPIPDHKTTPVAQTTRIVRASVGKRARRKRKGPSGNGTNHHGGEPTASPIDWPALSMTVGVALITNRAHPACTMAKLTRSRRPAADSRASRNTPLTAAELAAPEGMLIAEGRAESSSEVAAPWTPALDSAFAPRRSRRQPARLKSSRVGSAAMAMAAAKAIALPPVPPDREQTRPRRCRWRTGRRARPNSTEESRRRTPEHATARSRLRGRQRSRRQPTRSPVGSRRSRSADPRTSCYSWERHPPRSDPNLWQGRAPSRSGRARATGHPPQRALPSRTHSPPPSRCRQVCPRAPCRGPRSGRARWSAREARGSSAGPTRR